MKGFVVASFLQFKIFFSFARNVMIYGFLIFFVI